LDYPPIASVQSPRQRRSTKACAEAVEEVAVSLILHYHPLSSFCWKVLIGLYENDTPFERVEVNLGDEVSRAAFLALWPIGKFPVIQDGEAVVSESSIILEHLDLHAPGRTRFVPADPQAALRERYWDRVIDAYVHVNMQKCVGDNLRPEGKKDPFGVEQAKAQMKVAYGLLERELERREWLGSEGFGLADCAAAPALWYGDKCAPVADFPNLKAYLERLKARPPFARVLKEAEPYMQFFPGSA
jgi:glutathione S-transferase